MDTTHTISASSYSSIFIGFLPTTPRTYELKNSVRANQCTLNGMYQVHIFTTITERELAIPYRLTPRYTANATKLYYYPCVFPCLSSSHFFTAEYFVLGSHSRASYFRQLYLIALSILASSPDTPCSEETTRLHWQVSCTQLCSSYRQGLVISYGPTTLIYSPSGGMSRQTLSGLNGFTQKSFH